MVNKPFAPKHIVSVGANADGKIVARFHNSRGDAQSLTMSVELARELAAMLTRAVDAKA